MTAPTDLESLRIDPGAAIAPAGGESLDLVGEYSLHGVAELHAATGLGLPVSGDAHKAATARRLLEDFVNSRPGSADALRRRRAGLTPGEYRAAHTAHVAAVLADAYAYQLGTTPTTTAKETK